MVVSWGSRGYWSLASFFPGRCHLYSSGLLLAFIHLSTENRDSRKFVCRGFSEGGSSEAGAKNGEMGHFRPVWLLATLQIEAYSDFPDSLRAGILGSREKFAHAGEKAQGSIKTVSNAQPVIERVRGQL